MDSDETTFQNKLCRMKNKHDEQHEEQLDGFFFLLKKGFFLIFKSF